MTGREPFTDNMHPTHLLHTQDPRPEETTVIDVIPTSSWRHPVNTGHLVMGVAFAGILAVWALFATDTVDADDLRWLSPLPWVIAGAVGLAAATHTNLRHRRQRETGDEFA